MLNREDMLELTRRMPECGFLFPFFITLSDFQRVLFHCPCIE